MTEIKKGLYRHYKGPYYKVFDVAKHSETQECLVVYQALYGEKGMWVRPAEMFAEKVTIEGRSVDRFAYVDPQTEVLEMAVLNVKQGEEPAFERAFAKAQSIIASVPGYISHSVNKCIENKSDYLLLVNWQRLEDHEKGFRSSPEYQDWKALLHHFYEPFPQVLHFQELNLHD